MTNFPLLVFTLLAFFSLLSWLYLFFARHFFWNVRSSDSEAFPPLPANRWPRVVAIIPARNEADSIAATIASLAAQNYPGDFSVTLVDDHSDDSTSAIAAQSIASNAANSLHKFQILQAPPLPAHWTGKLHALNHGIAHHTASSDRSAYPPDFYWFTDADIQHSPDTLTRLVTRAAAKNLDLTSLMVLLSTRTLPEKFLIPPFLYFFLLIYPPRAIANKNSPIAGAAGGCILLRASALARIGGLHSIRSAVIDDCSLAAAVKNSGGSIWLGLTTSSISSRRYSSFREIANMIARTAFTQLRYSYLILLAALLGLALTYLVPIAIILLAAIYAFAVALGAFLPGLEFSVVSAAKVPLLLTLISTLAAFLLMTFTFSRTIRFYRLSPLWSFTLPFAALFYAAATCLSAIRFSRGRGAQWKGRIQATK